MLLPSLVLTTLVALSSATPLPPSSLQHLPSDFVLAPLITPPPPPSSSGGLSTQSHIIADSYLVVLDDHLDPHLVDQHHAHAQALHAADSRLLSLKSGPVAAPSLTGLVHKFAIGSKTRQGRNKVHGYTGQFSESTLDAIRALKGVKYVERDSVVYASEVEKGAPWGLARISHRDPLSFGTFNKYEYDGNGGEGVDAYVIDTGVNVDHVELEGRATWGKTIPKDVDADSNGHGSHVAGTIASKKYGVAKKAHIIAVKVLGAGGSGTMADVVAGVAWAADAAYAKAKKNDPKHKGSVANMSLGGGSSPTLDNAVDAAVEDGLHFAVAAGNDNKDACAYSPAASKEAITVGASTIGDARAYFSNYGKCVDIFAPGLNILSIWNTGNTSINTISGTSMASPHVAGLAAYFLSLYPTSFSPEELDSTTTSATIERLPSFVQSGLQMVFGSANKLHVTAPVPKKPLSPKALKKALAKVASKGLLTSIGDGSPNLLIFNNYTTSAIQEAMESAVVEVALEASA
ncbi:hypothetical protein MNV49_007531 [Pseudohyphozyma bogoriensis]|nr:hypothetical protein MNV49_007531 [Pseudohyphozyma bogoriensis]